MPMEILFESFSFLSVLRPYTMSAFFSFSNFPVKICLYLGVVGMILTILAIVYIAIGKITGAAPAGWSSLMLSIYFIGSVQLISIGILGEYIFRVYKETQNRPIFLVRDFINDQSKNV